MGRELVFGEKVVTKIIGDERVTIELKLYSLGGRQDAYFSVSGEVRSKYARRDSDPWACGQVQDRYARHFAEVRRYNKWHLTSVDGPMHYKANALYWFDKYLAGGDRDRYSNHSAEECLRFAASTAVWGALEGETLDELAELSRAKFAEALDERLPRLMAKFYADMAELFGEDAIFSALQHAAEQRGMSLARRVGGLLDETRLLTVAERLLEVED